MNSLLPAHFGRGTKLTVLGKQFTFLLLCTFCAGQCSVFALMENSGSHSVAGQKTSDAQCFCTGTALTKPSLEKAPDSLF